MELQLKSGNFFKRLDLELLPAMLKRFQDIATLPEKECMLTNVDHFIKVSKISMLFIQN